MGRTPGAKNRTPEQIEAEARRLNKKAKAMRSAAGEAVSGELMAVLGDVWVRVAAVQAIIPVANRPEKTTLVLCGSLLDVDLPIEKVVQLLATAEERVEVRPQPRPYQQGWVLDSNADGEPG